METHFPRLDENRSEIARQRVMTDLCALATDAEALLRVTADDVSEKTKEARARLLAGLEKAKAGFVTLKSQAMESARAAASKADEMIRARPYESIAVAFGIGVLLGVLLRRK